MTTELASALESAGVQLKKSGEDWTARVRAGLRERTAALPLEAREAELSDDVDERRRQLASYARGAYLGPIAYMAQAVMKRVRKDTKHLLDRDDEEGSGTIDDSLGSRR